MTRVLSPKAITRRSLLRGASAVGASSLMLPFGAAAVAAMARRGGTLRIATGPGSVTDSHDPRGWTSLHAQFYAATRHNTLTEIAADGQLTGEIAESWDTSDGRTWLLRIREGVTFHSGKVLDVGDVIASLDYHRRTPGAVAGPLLSDVTDMRADGPWLVIDLARPNADFPLLLSDVHLPILPAHYGAIDPLSSDGCGAYVAQAYTPGHYARLTRNPDYWKPGRAHVDVVEIVAAQGPDALEEGLADVVFGLDRAGIARLTARPEATVLAVSGTQHHAFAMDVRAAPYDNPDIRRALKYAMPREALVHDVLGGHGRIGNDHPIGPAHRFFDATLAQCPFDPDRARHHLRRAGHDRLALTLTLSDAAFAGATEAGVIVAGAAAQAGIDITLNRVAAAGYWADHWRQTPFAASTWSGRLTEDWAFATAYASGAPWSEGHWAHPRFDSLLAAARATLDDRARAALYAEMQAICATEGPAVIPAFADYILAHDNRVGRPEAIGSNAPLDGLRIAERWWMT